MMLAVVESEMDDDELDNPERGRLSIIDVRQSWKFTSAFFALINRS